MTDDDLSIPGVRPRRRFGRLLVVLLVALVAGGAYVWRCRLSTYHLATVQPQALYRDGNQSPCQFETAVRRVQPKGVVSLVDDAEMHDEDKPQFQAEAEFLQKQGVRLERVPIKLGGWPTKADVERVLAKRSCGLPQAPRVRIILRLRRGQLLLAFVEVFPGDAVDLRR